MDETRGGPFLRSLQILLKETFASGEGIYLDSRTSLLETLDTVNAEQASQRFSPKGANVAAHVEHMLLYLDVLGKSIQGEDAGKIDWEEIWRNTHDVTPKQWDDLRRRLRSAYEETATLMDSVTNWNEEDMMDSALAILSHNAYHLGAIRQILYVVQP